MSVAAHPTPFISPTLKSLAVSVLPHSIWENSFPYLLSCVPTQCPLVFHDHWRCHSVLQVSLASLRSWDPSPAMQNKQKYSTKLPENYTALSITNACTWDAALLYVWETEINSGLGHLGDICLLTRQKTNSPKSDNVTWHLCNAFHLQSNL
jgi:hypothetical protein